MSGTKFTPGPWQFNKYGGIGNGPIGTSQLIINSDGWAHDYSPDERERCAADRRLIRAAPKLHAALERLTYYLNGINESGVHAPSSDEWADANKQAQEVLSEIRGEPAETGKP